MNEMIEIVAKALVLADEQNGCPPWEYCLLQGKHVMNPIFDRARAAIEAMRAPTEAMVEAAWSVLEEMSEYGETRVSRHRLREFYERMIDEALK